jgi:O-antigen ligase
MARILLAAALFGAPLALGAVIPWAWATLGLVAGLGLFLWALGSVRQGALKLFWSPLYIPLAMFLLLGMVQYAAGLTLDKSETRQALVLLVTDLTFFFLAVQFFSGAGGKPWRGFGLAVLVFAGSLGLFTILQSGVGVHRIYGVVDTPYGLVYGPYVDRDHFAGLMEMLLPVAVLYIVGRRGKSSLEASVGLVSAATLALASLLLSGSRGGLLALAAEIAIVTCALARSGARTSEKGRVVMAGGITLLAGLLLFAYLDPGWAGKKLGSVANVNTAWAEWAGFRKSMTLDALRMWRSHPVLGVGLGDFATAYPRYQSVANDWWVDHAHNDYAEAAAETGLVGTLLILSALALFLRLVFGDWGRSSPCHAGYIRFGAGLGCCGLLVHSLCDFNLHIPANAAWLAFLAGIATAKPASEAAE